MLDFTNYDDSLIRAILIMQASFKRVKPDSSRQWQARASLLHAINLLAGQLKDQTIKITTGSIRY